MFTEPFHIFCLRHIKTNNWAPKHFVCVQNSGKRLLKVIRSRDCLLTMAETKAEMLEEVSESAIPGVSHRTSSDVYRTTFTRYSLLPVSLLYYVDVQITSRPCFSSLRALVPGIVLA